MSENFKVILDYVPDNCYEENIVGIEKMSVTYTQQADTNSSSDDIQTLTIETQNNGMGENGIYFNIKTDKWSIDDASHMADVINDFMNRLEYNTVKVDSLKTVDR